MNRIEEVLENKGIKQTWLADKLAKSYNMVNSYVKNRRQPSLDDLYRIAEILGVDASELLTSKAREDFDASTESNDTIKVPLLGEVACGIPILAVENVQAEIPISTKMLKRNSNYFLLRASGDSMDLAGINHGDLVLLKQEQTARNGDLVLALIDDEATLKEFNRTGNMVVLKPKSTNESHQPIILTDDFKVQGVVEQVIPI